MAMTIGFEDILDADGAPSYRQLDHWVRAGYIRVLNPHEGSGVKRVFPAAELQIAVSIHRLAKAGLTVKAAHRVARGETELAPGVRVEVTA